MTSDEFVAYQKWLATQTPAPTPTATVAPTTAPAIAPIIAPHEEVAAAPILPKGPVVKAFEDINALHQKTHNLFKCKGCRSDLESSLKSMGLDVRDKGDRIIIDGLPDE